MNPARSVPGILIVERDDELRDLLNTLLSEEGYEVHAVSALNDAVRRLDEQVFRLVLADLFIGRSPHGFTEGHILRRRAHPIPVGILTACNIAPEEATRQGFAFLLSEPFEIDDLLALVAAAINQPFSAEQQRLAEIVWRFFTALQDADWQTIATLCTENLTYYPLPSAPFTHARKIQGLSAYLSIAEAARRGMLALRFSMITLFALPKGLAAHYQVSWTPPDDMPQQLTGAMLFHFRGERIAQMGNRQNEKLLRADNAAREAPPPERVVE